MPGEYAVELRDVVKRFVTPEGRDMEAVNHVTMQIRHGEFFSMLGPSGCGKTTSLRLIAGFEWPTSGEVYIDGSPQRHRPPFLRPVNTVFQSYALFQHMTVHENVASGLRWNMPKDEISSGWLGRWSSSPGLTGAAQTTLRRATAARAGGPVKTPALFPMNRSAPRPLRRKCS
jgi:ABC-type sugar transport system ATPase subunit